ncbi:MAG TPA: hypothetical protein VFS47_11115, partial [Steroidobacteraceae bacterium]|nr:hypothetical protein [Steroidobacteraceae bacterium]
MRSIGLSRKPIATSDVHFALWNRDAARVGQTCAVHSITSSLITKISVVEDDRVKTRGTEVRSTAVRAHKVVHALDKDILVVLIFFFFALFPRIPLH